MNTFRIINSDLSTPLVKKFSDSVPKRFSLKKWVMASSGVVIRAVVYTGIYGYYCNNGHADCGIPKLCFITFQR